MTSKRTAADFKDHHDPLEMLAKQAKQLATAEKELGLQRAIAATVGASLKDTESYAPPAWVVKPPKGQEGAPGVPTLFLSDIHAGEVVQPSQVSGVNSYNLTILRQRMKHTITTAVHLCSILDSKMRYPGIVVPLGGDMVSGDIHEELVATNELPTIPVVLELYEYLTQAIVTLLEHFPAVFLPCVSGNHGRNTKKMWAKNRNHTSFDWLLYQILAKRFQNEPRVTFYVPAASDALYRVYNVRYLLTHGDQFRGGDGIIGPLGPIFRGTQKKLARNQAVGQDFEVAIMGHWHQYIHTERVIVNGSMKGYDEYAAQSNFGFEPPRQALWITHPRYGINWRMPVLCEAPAPMGGKVDWVSIAK